MLQNIPRIEHGQIETIEKRSFKKGNFKKEIPKCGNKMLHNTTRIEHGKTGCTGSN